MTRARSAFVFMLLLAGTPSAASGPENGRPLITPAAIERALSTVPVHLQSMDPRGDWSRIQQLSPSTEIVVTARGMTARGSRFVSADAATLTVVDLENPNHPTRRIERDDVTEVRLWTGRRGSKLGAVIGAGAGFFVGYLAAINLAMKDCEGSCSDEKFLVGLSLVGLPIGGGLVGYHLPKAGRTLQTIYIKP